MKPAPNLYDILALDLRQGRDWRLLARGNEEGEHGYDSG